ncbi:MAG: hypothetical protein CMM61_15860 [Rhodospirillaceae bacterium]|nr:hypothetical protein [Rhodospirillaceae bacterium]
MPNTPAIDPITLEICWKRLESIVEEMAATLVRTSFSTCVRDLNDYACSLFDADARLLVQSRDSTPGLCGPLGNMLRHMLTVIPPEDLEDGDVLIGNDPWHASGHHNDITVATPAFHGGRLIGFVMSCAHQTDIGGRRGTDECRDNYEEGLRIPVVKYHRAGEPNREAMAFIHSNVRSADLVLGDLAAQCAANYVGVQRLGELCGEKEWADVQALGDEMIVRTDKVTRDAIAAVPNGIYEASAPVMMIGDDPVVLAVAVHVRDEEIEIDYSASSPVVARAINCTRTYTHAYTVFTLSCMLDLPVSLNEGTLEHLKTKTKPDTILDARFPAPVNARTNIGTFIPEIIMRALAPAMPDRAIAGGGGTPLWGQYMSGRWKDGKPFAPLNFSNGGLGGRPGMDGGSCLAFPTNVGNTPTEILEREVPAVVLRRELWPNSEGPGTYRGGFGQIFGLRILDGDQGPDGAILMTLRGGRLNKGVPGLLGGGDSLTGRATLNGEDVDVGVQFEAKPQDVLECYIPGGGGFGDPLERSRERVEDDILNGLVDASRAAAVYGYPLAAE